MMVAEEKKEKWDHFLENSEIKTLSKLIRISVDEYIESRSKIKEMNLFLNYVHELKGELSSIKGFSQMLIEEYKDELSWDLLLKIKEIYDKSISIEKIMNKIFKKDRVENEQYDLLIVDDDDSTVHLISDFFIKKGYSCRSTSTGADTLELLNSAKPKIILIDVILSDYNGYEICMKIKAQPELKSIPVYYITAVPETEVIKKTKESGADGYFLKPFNMSEFNILLNYL